MTLTFIYAIYQIFEELSSIETLITLWNNLPVQGLFTANEEFLQWRYATFKPQHSDFMANQIMMRASNPKFSHTWPPDSKFRPGIPNL